MSAPALLSFLKLDSPVMAPRWRLTFSEPVTGLRSTDVSLSGDGAYFSGATLGGLEAEGDGTSWLLSVTPGAGEGKIIPSFTGAGVRDADGLLMPGVYWQALYFATNGVSSWVVLDANADGRLDIASGNSLRLGAGNGSFGAAVALAGGQANGVPLVIDGNGDGRKDLVVAGENGASFLVANSAGGFNAGTPIELGGKSRFLLAADIDGDGRQDVLAVDYLGPVRVALQLASGGFAPAVTTAIAPSNNYTTPQIAVGDINGDGLADLVSIDNGLGGVRLWLGQANGSLLAGGSVPLGVNGSGVALADVDGDARLDLLTWGRTLSVRLGDGAGGFGERIESNTAIPSITRPQFRLPPAEVPREVPVQVVKDVTGDGIVDIIGISHQALFYFGDYYADEAFMIPGLGGGRFGGPVSLANQTSLLGDFRAYADFNNDGRDDFLTSPLVGPQLFGFIRQPGMSVSLAYVPAVEAADARFYTPPKLLSITVPSPDAVLTVGDLAVFTLNFDKAVWFDSLSFLRLSNGALATRGAADTNGDRVTFSYRVAENEAAGNLEVLGISGTVFDAAPSGLHPDLGEVPEIAGQLRVASPNVLYFSNGDGRLASWAMNGLSVVDKVLLSYTAGGAVAVVHSNSNNAFTSPSGGDALFYRSGHIAAVTATTPPAGGTSLGFAGSKWSFVGDGGSGELSGRVFWHSDQGEVVFWDTSGASSPRAWLGQASLDWRVTAIADTTGDGAADVIFQNQDGRVALWQVTGSAVVAQAVIDIVTPDWRLVAAGDLNGDGRADLLYRNGADNRLVARFLDGFAGIGDNQVIGIASTDWNIADLRDMNGDGREDILWRNPSGDFAVWTMDGARVLSQQLLDKVSPDWVLLT